MKLGIKRGTGFKVGPLWTWCCLKVLVFVHSRTSSALRLLLFVAFCPGCQIYFRCNLYYIYPIPILAVPFCCKLYPLLSFYPSYIIFLCDEKVECTPTQYRHVKSFFFVPVVEVMMAAKPQGISGIKRTDVSSCSHRTNQSNHKRTSWGVLSVIGPFRGIWNHMEYVHMYTLYQPETALSAQNSQRLWGSG